jgi:hypothetical protein
MIWAHCWKCAVVNNILAIAVCQQDICLGWPVCQIVPLLHGTTICYTKFAPTALEIYLELIFFCLKPYYNAYISDQHF